MPVKIESGSEGHGSAYPQPGTWTFRRVGSNIVSESGGTFLIGPRNYAVQIDASEYTEEVKDKAIIHIISVTNRTSGDTRQVDEYLAPGDSFQFEPWPEGQEVDQGMTMRYEIFLPENVLSADKEEYPKRGTNDSAGWEVSDISERFGVSKSKAQKLIRFRDEEMEQVKTALAKLRGTYSPGREDDSEENDTTEPDEGQPSNGRKSKGFIADLSNREKLMAAGAAVGGGYLLWRLSQ